MARIPYVDPKDMPAEIAELLKTRFPLNLYRMLPHAPTIAPGLLRMGGGILRESLLDPKLREIAILRVGVLSKASYEVHQHKRIAKAVGLADETIKAIERGPEDKAFAPLERLIMRFTDEVVHNVKASDALFREAEAALGHRRLAELVMTIGFYMLISRFLENFEVDIEPEGAIPELTADLRPRPAQ
jgi:4-carboxymuconolactone decarboxylase